MSVDGTAAHLATSGLPPLVARAVETAGRAGFENSCRPAHGRLLSVLAGGIGAGRIGETGTGCGVGLAWLATAASADCHARQRRARPGPGEPCARASSPTTHAFPCSPATGSALEREAPFDLLVLDGCGHGKRGGQPMDPALWLRPGGLLVIDDFAPSDTWPPTYGDGIDETRLLWLTHPLLLATEIRTDPDAAAIVARLRPG